MSAIAEEVNSTERETVQSKNILKTFIDQHQLSSVCLPSSLWGVHLDSQRKFLAFSMLKIGDDSVQTSKSVVLSETDDHILRTDVFMDNISVQIPYVSHTVSNVQDLKNLLNAVDAVGFCKYYSTKNKDQCLIVKLAHMDVCSRCLYSPCNANRNLEQDNSKTENIDTEKLRDITSCNEQEKLGNSTKKNDNIQCILCNKKFSNGEQLSAHYKTHLSKNANGQFKCTICSNEFSNIIPVLEHYKDYHGSVKFIKCTMCTKKYTNAQQLRRHIRNHTGYEAFSCGHCNKDFVSKIKRKNHTCTKSTRRHNLSKLYICSTCNTKYATSLLLQQHQREHRSHISLKCRKCNKNFDNEDAAVEHKMQCKNQLLKYMCDMCDKKFSCISQKLSHMKKVHPLYM